MRDVPEYLEAPDNEDSGADCRYCGEPTYDAGPHPDLCFDCGIEEEEDLYWDQVIDDYEDRMLFPEDYEMEC